MDRGNVVAGAGKSTLAALISKLPAVGVGVLTAVATVLVLDAWRAPGTPVPGASTELVEQARASQGEQRVIRSVVVDSAANDRITALERQISEMRPATNAEAKDPTPLEEASLDPEEARRQVHNEFAEFDRQHERDLPDPDWSPSATRYFATGLAALAEKVGFSVGALDCKTTTCRAIVTWPDYLTARRTRARVVEESFQGLNCEQRILMPEPSDPNAPYSTRLQLDCTDLRAGTVEALAVVQ